MPNISEIARWIGQEHAAVEDLSARLLERAAMMPRLDPEPWLEALKSEFERYRAHFEKHMALEEQGGYLQPVIDLRPMLAPEVERLRAEHRAISQLMRAIAESVGRLKPEDRLLVRDTCCRIENLVTLVNEHEDRENMLVSCVFTHDVGTKD